MWLTTFDPLGWPTPRVYVVLVGPDRRPAPVVTEIDEIPDRLSAEDARSLMAVYADLMGDLADRCSLALLVCRPGPGPVTDRDRECCADLYAAAGAARIDLEVIHVGTDRSVVPVPEDSMLPRSA